MCHFSLLQRDGPSTSHVMDRHMRLEVQAGAFIPVWRAGDCGGGSDMEDFLFKIMPFAVVDCCYSWIKKHLAFISFMPRESLTQREDENQKCD